MSYYGDSASEKAAMRLEAKIKRIYAEAARDVEQKILQYTDTFKKRDAEMQKKLKNGEISQADYDNWKSRIVFRGKRWNNVRDTIWSQLYHTRQTTTDMINGERKAMFQNVVNFSQYQIDKDFNFSLSFNIYDNATVTRLIKEDPDLVPDVKYPVPGRDYAWSKKQIASAATQGVIQGESIPEISRRIANKLSSANMVSMTRCARTAMTGAHNSGRIEAMHNAEDLGIKVQKLWIATLDSRTRDWHRDLDGQLAEVDEPFYSHFGEIMYPGDPNARPANVWNCFVGDIKVASDSEIIRSYKHDYSGELFTIKTASGVEFTCTPNHPILTDRGWVGAKFLNDGDRLAQTRIVESECLRINPDVDHTLPCFDTIHKFFEIMGVKRTCRLGVNFHGDVPTSDVEIVSKKRFLRKYFDACKLKSKNKLGFKLPLSFVFSKSHFMPCFRRVYVSFFSFVGGMRNALSFLWRRISHSCVHGFGAISDMNSFVFESQSDGTSCNAEIFSDGLDGLSRRVFFDNIVSIQVSSVSHIPVYNLQTNNGYYFVSSNASINDSTGEVNGSFAIAHNCRCSLGWEYPEYKNQYDTRAAREEEANNGGQVEEIPYMSYNKWVQWVKDGKPEIKKEIPKPKEPEIDQVIQNFLKECEQTKIKYHEVKKLDTDWANDNGIWAMSEIFERLHGGDLTSGSCASLALAYAGNRCGYDVIDFRGGASQTKFSSGYNLRKLFNATGVETITEKDTNDIKACERLFNQMKDDKEYILCTGKHASIVRKQNGSVQYLELQSATNGGWHDFEKDTLKWRFGCQRSHSTYGMKYERSNELVDVESFKNFVGFDKVLGYINTPENEQKKGRAGHEK